LNQRLTPDPAKNEDLERIVTWATGLRLALAAGLELSGLSDRLGPDGYDYHYGAALLAEWWAGDESAYPAWIFRHAATGIGYYYIVGAIYFVSGPWRLLPVLLNAFVGGRMVRLVHTIALEITDSTSTALRAARLTAYLPSLVLWSALNLRDIWVVLTVLIIIRSALALQRQASMRRLAVLGAGLVALVQLRYYLLTPVAASVIVALILRRRKDGGTMLRNAALAGATFGLMGYAQAAGGPERQVTLSLEVLQQGREDTAYEGTSVGDDADVASPIRALSFLPLGLTYFLFAPFPWAVTSVLQAITIPEMLFLYSMAPATLRGALGLWRNRFTESLAPLLVTAALCCGYALGQANLGTAYRQRAQVLPLFMMFAAYGREPVQRKERRSR
jgi:hypothetical protein